MSIDQENYTLTQSETVYHMLQYICIFLRCLATYVYCANLLLFSGLILKGENFEVFMDFALSLKLNFSDILHCNGIFSIFEAYLVTILKLLSTKSFYYPIHEKFPPRH